MSLSYAIVQARKAAGYATQRDFAKALGIGADRLSRYESGVTRPSDEMVAQMEHVLGLGHGQLLIDAGLVYIEAAVLADGEQPLRATSPDSQLATRDGVSLPKRKSPGEWHFSPACPHLTARFPQISRPCAQGRSQVSS